MPDLQQMQRQKTEKLGKMRSLLTKAEEEKRDLSEDELNEFNDLDKEVAGMNSSIDRELRLAKLEGETRNLPNIQLDNNAGDDPTGERGAAGGSENQENRFENLGEFFATIVTDRRDERLQSLYRKGEGRAAQKMGVGQLGGFAIPDQFLADIKSVTPQEAIIRPGATKIPAGEPPDAEIKIPALDQGAAQNMYGGIEVIHSGETLTITETEANLRQVTMKPKSIKGFIPLSNELLENWPAATAFLQNQMRLAAIGSEDYDFYRGSGVNRATGIVNCACRIEYTRATASTFVFADALGMLARMKLGGRLMWIASQTVIPQLAAIRDAGSNNLWIQNTVEGMPSMFFGFPLRFSERAPVLGSTGDISLVDLSYYLIKDGSGPRVDISKEFLFQNDETCFRIVWMVDGKPWLNEPIPLEGSTSNTVSPFVILK